MFGSHSHNLLFEYISLYDSLIPTSGLKISRGTPKSILIGKRRNKSSQAFKSLGDCDQLKRKLETKDALKAFDSYRITPGREFEILLPHCLKKEIEESDLKMLTIPFESVPGFVIFSPESSNPDSLSYECRYKLLLPITRDYQNGINNSRIIKSTNTNEPSVFVYQEGNRIVNYQTFDSNRFDYLSPWKTRLNMAINKAYRSNCFCDDIQREIELKKNSRKKDEIIEDERKPFSITSSLMEILSANKVISKRSVLSSMIISSPLEISPAEFSEEGSKFVDALKVVSTKLKSLESERNETRKDRQSKVSRMDMQRSSFPVAKKVAQTAKLPGLTVSQSKKRDAANDYFDNAMNYLTNEFKRSDHFVPVSFLKLFASPHKDNCVFGVAKATQENLYKQNSGVFSRKTLNYDDRQQLLNDFRDLSEKCIVLLESIHLLNRSTLKTMTYHSIVLLNTQ